MNSLGRYDTILSAEESEAFRAWRGLHAPNDSGVDYDLRGAFRAGLRPDTAGHFLDTYKKPNHPTFSVESVYACGDDLAAAGRWDGDIFIPPGAD